jgi:hypothetical protein
MQAVALAPEARRDRVEVRTVSWGERVAPVVSTGTLSSDVRHRPGARRERTVPALARQTVVREEHRRVSA